MEPDKILKEKTIHHIRKEIASLLSEVSDPEIPGISIVDLGMVLDIRPENGHWRIDLATTYTGCPAIDVIPIITRQRLQQAGFEDVRVEMEISPPWTTDWISEEGKVKLHEFGIAPPHGSAFLQKNEGKPAKCPQCGATELELISRYGATPCKAAYRCLTCLEPFEYFKCF